MMSITVGTSESFVLRVDVETNSGQVSLRKGGRLEAHQGSVRSLVGAGSWLASSGSDDIIRLYDIASGDAFACFNNPSVDVQCLAFVRNQNEDEGEPTHLLGGSVDGSISIWDFGAKQPEPGELLGHKAGVNSIAVHCEGKIAVSASRDSKMILWNLVEGKKALVGQLNSEARTVAFHPNEEALVLACEDTVHLTSLAQSKEIGVWRHQRRVSCMSVLENHGLVGTGTEDGILRLWDARSGENPCVQIEDAHNSRVKGMHGMGDVIATGCSNGDVKVWDLRTTAKKRFDTGLLCSLSTGARITCLTLSSTVGSESEGNRPDFMEESDTTSSSDSDLSDGMEIGGKRRLEAEELSDSSDGSAAVPQKKKRQKHLKVSKSEGNGEVENLPPCTPPPPTAHSPAGDVAGPSTTPAKGLRSALKSGKGRCPSASPGGKKKVCFKDGDSLVEVVGVASGVGFDSVPGPMWMQYEIPVMGGGKKNKGRGKGGRGQEGRGEGGRGEKARKRGGRGGKGGRKFRR